MPSTRIALVKDSDEVRHSLTLLLRTRGFSVQPYRTAVEVLSSPFLPEADCFLIDYKMPSINGIELLNRLRADGVAAPALMITGFVTTYLTDVALQAGFAAVIEKPPPHEILVNKILAVTGKNQHL